MSDPSAPRLHFGGPDHPPRLLRNLLQQRVDATPAGGEIVWCTYYFRDRQLAQALIAARDRGARVSLSVEGHPRLAGANDIVISMLDEAGMDLRVHRAMRNPFNRVRPHLHSKIYCFSHPTPSALVGSFNPSGDLPENAAVLAEIGDQDVGHNVLVELRETGLVEGLRTHAKMNGRGLARWRPAQNRPIASDCATAYFYPRLRPLVVEARLARLGGDANIIGAVSHLKPSAFVDRLCAAASAGAPVRLLVHDTERRVPQEVVARLSASGVDIRRYDRGWRMPLHAKFLVVEGPDGGAAYFGSLNFNRRSRWYNHELLLASRHPSLVAGFRQRFEQIAAEF